MNAPVRNLQASDTSVRASAVVERAALTRAVEIATSVVEKRNAIPVLGNIKLVGNGSTLFITATDLDVEISVAVQAAADIHFGETVAAHTLKDLLKKAPAAEFVAITAATYETRDRLTRVWDDEARAHKLVPTGETYQEMVAPAVLDFERAKYKLPAIHIGDFPAWSQKTDVAFNIDGRDLLAALNRTSGAISFEESRYYLNGIYFHRVNDELRFVATDGHRLYRQDLAAPFGSEGMAGVIIPHKTVRLLEKLMKGKNCPEKVKVAVGETGIRFSFGDITVSSRVIDGAFPDYQRVTPTNNENIAVLDVKNASEAVDAVMAIITERGRSIKMTFDTNKVGMEVNNPDAGTAHAEIACEYQCDPMEIGFNARYFAELLKVADSDSITVKMADPGAPAVITGERAGWMAVIMPMRV